MIDAGAPSSNPQDAQTYSITGQANSATPYGPMLRIYGRHRIFPRLAAVPFTVAEGPHQFLYMLLDCGYGPLAIDDLQIGDTAILNFRDVLYRIWPRWKAGDPLDYYRNDTTFENFNLTLHTGSPEVRTTAADASGIVLDFLMPKGLVTFDDRGDRTARSVVFAVELREAGSGGAWVPLRTFPVYVSTPASMQISAGLLNAQAPANDSEGGGEDNPTSGGPYFPAGATAFGLTRRHAAAGRHPVFRQSGKARDPDRRRDRRRHLERHDRRAGAGAGIPGRSRSVAAAAVVGMVNADHRRLARAADLFDDDRCAAGRV
jgi:hypothetical protein